MKFKNIQIKGIGRLPGNMIENGYCDELINLRHKDGVLRAIGNKQVTGYNNPSGTWSYMWIHQMDTVTNLIGYNSSYELCKIETSGSSSVIKAYTSAQSDLRVVTMKRFLVVLATNTYDVFHWDGTDYNLVAITAEPELLFYAASASPATHTTAQVSTAEALLGAYFDSINTKSQNNYCHGSIAIRLAYKLYDGSYIFHTLPKILFCNPSSVYQINKSAGPLYSITHSTRKVSVISPSNSMYNGIDKNIVVAVCVFATRMEDYYKIDETTITDTLLSGLSITSHTFSSLNIAKNENYGTLADSPSWYMVKEIPLSKLQNLPSYNFYSEELDTTNFYQDYGTRETLPVDSFSHQKLTSYAYFNYNSRLLIGKISTIFESLKLINADPPSGSYTNVSSVWGYIRVIINTDSGQCAVYYRQYFDKIMKSGANYYLFFSGYANGISEYKASGAIGYPDIRATKIDILLNVSGNDYFLFGSFPLTKSLYDNYAYYKASDFGTIQLTNTVLSNVQETIDTATLTASNSFTDINRVQASELSNPLVFPAENSYQVGTGSIIAICAASEPLSTGQFGEYPVHIFTTKGIYALNQGSGDVLFSTVTPASPEVANNRDNVISLGSGVVFTTVDGIYVIQGRQVKDIGKIMYGKPDTDLKDNAHLHRFLNGGNLPYFPDTKLSDINFQDYLSGSVIGYDKQNNELVISDDSKQYSYVYNFDSGFWSKVDIAYSVLINNYPELWGVTIAAKILNISVEYWDYPGTSTPAPVPIMFLTRPIKIDADGIFSLIHRTWLRCFVNTPSYLLTGIYVFGSNDMITWQFLTGMQREGQIHDMRLTRIHSKVKYFSVMFTAAMDRNSHIGNIELQYYNKLTNKIR